MIKPSISIIMPAYNSGPYIEQAIESVLAQTYWNWELIIVDDGSSDDTIKRVEKYLEDKRITYSCKSNGGAASARNYGIKIANADLLAFIDADDYWLPTKLEKQTAIMIKYPEVGVCGTAETIVSVDGIPIRESVTGGFHGMPFPRLLFSSLADMTTALIRREVFEKIGLFDETLRIAPDKEFWLRAGRLFCFHTIDESLACYRTGHGSISETKLIERRMQFLNIVLPRFLKEQDGYKYVKPWHVWKVKSQCFLDHSDSSTSCLGRVLWILRAIVAYPLHTNAYCTLAATILPSFIYQKLKTAKTCLLCRIRILL